LGVVDPSGSDPKLPPLTAKEMSGGASITIPGLSFAFYVLKHAAAKACRGA
jgi:hypothetical protein